MEQEYSPFEELQSALSLLPDAVRVMDALNRTYRRYLDARTRHLGISLVGPFAQTDYLLKERRAPKSLRKAINDARVLLRKGEDPTKWAFCLFSLADFVSFVDKVEIPEDLQLTLNRIHAEYASPAPSPSIQEVPDVPSEDVPEPSATISSSSHATTVYRFILDYWDETYMYGRVDGMDDEQPFRVRYAPTFSYLRSMLFANAQFNLVHPYEKDDALHAELIILEPDYLVNITSVASCFEAYDESPYVYLLKKLMPNEQTEHTILGNFAGQMLDEELHGEVSYAQSVKAFFHQHASALLTTPLPEDFHERAREQRQNIHHAMSEVLPAEVGGFRREKVLLEPSFYSEMLGLQGRMDLLQTDMKVLIEQKSGKGAFVPGDSDPDTPHPQEPHYVQMLLYMLLVRYNYPEAYHSGSEGIQAFLLYSKYKNSLVKLDFAPDLVHRAIRIRNGIAWMENQLGGVGQTSVSTSTSASWDWRKLLLPLTPEILNTKKLANRLWIDYKRPELASLLAPIHNASPLERAYYFRLLQFLSREHLLAKIGNKNRQNAGFAAAWHDSLLEKRQAGNIYDALRLVSVSPLSFQFSDTANHDMANFRVGDIVVLYPYADEAVPDLRYTMVHRASIEQITADTIKLHLRAEQTDAELFLRHEKDLWAIEHDFMEASYSSLYRGVHTFLSAPKERRDLLLLQREPAVRDDLLITGEYGSFNDLMLRVKRAQDFFLIIGPPGTGKTSFGMLNTLREELASSPSSRVLLLSYTNRAVDEICSKLIEDNIDFLRLGSELSCAPEYRPYLFSNRVATLQGIEAVRHLFFSARVICATTTSATSHLDLLRLREFSLTIIDEASQILEPHLLGLLSATCQPGNEEEKTRCMIRRFVMIGDHKQLPAVVQQSAKESAVMCSEDNQQDEMQLLHEIGLHNCRLSLFERLLHRYRENPNIVFMLTRQGRMHHDIADFPNEAFYEGRLTEVPLPHQVAATPQSSADRLTLAEILRTRRVAFVDVPRPSSSISDKVNQDEANIIAEAVLQIMANEGEDFSPVQGIGIIVPYRNQIATVRNTIQNRLQQRETSHFDVSDLVIDTVERFQGSQRPYIIYGFTVQQPYQLDFLTDNTFEEDGYIIDRKLNVAMTRAQEHLLLVGNKALLQRVPLFNRLIEKTLVDYSFCHKAN